MLLPHELDPLIYYTDVREMPWNNQDRELFPLVHDCSHVSENDEFYHLCFNEERPDEKFRYEYIQCDSCIRRHFAKYHAEYLRTQYSEKIQAFINSRQTRPQS